MPSHFAVEQTSHVFIAATIVETAVLMGWSPLTGLLCVLAWATPKEYAFDLLVEASTLREETIDFLWYMASGVTVAGLLQWLH
jgi:hypothetical protein